MIQTCILVFFLMQICFTYPLWPLTRLLVDSLLLLSQDKQNQPVISSVTDSHFIKFGSRSKNLLAIGPWFVPSKKVRIIRLYQIKKRSFDILTLSLCSRKCRKHGELPPTENSHHLEQVTALSVVGCCNAIAAVQLGENILSSGVSMNEIN